MGHSNTDDDVTTDSSSAAESGTSSTKTDSGIIEHEDDDDLSSDLCPFFVGEKVLAYHNTHIYEAKDILIRGIQLHFSDEDLSLSRRLFRIWDEWVRLDRLLKYTDENREKQQLASKKDGTNKDPKPSRTQAKPTSHHGASGRKRKNHSAVKGAIVMDEFVIRMPPELREQLADDWQSVTHLDQRAMTFKLPELLVDANIEEETLKELVQISVDFLKFLHKNQSAFFLSYDHLPEDTEISTDEQDHKEWKGRIYFCNNSCIIL